MGNHKQLLQTLFLPPILPLSSLFPSFLPFSLLSLFFIIGEAICLLICGFSKFSFFFAIFSSKSTKYGKVKSFCQSVKALCKLYSF